jgi:hypothetical protein
LKELLARFMPHKGIGLYIGEHDVAVSQVVATPLGVVETVRLSEAYAPDELAGVVARLLKPLTSSPKRTPPIAVGIPARRVFFSTRPIQADSSGASPQAMLRDILRSPTVCIDEMTVEVTKGEFGKRTLASITSCRKEYLTDLLRTLRSCGVQPFRTEPAPLALLRVGILKRRARRGTKLVLRLFLHETEALAVVTAGHLCILWKPFKLSGAEDAVAVGAAIRSSQTLIRHCGIDLPLDIVLVHGRADLREELTSEEFVQRVGIPVAWCEGPESTGAEVAYGLALGCLGQQSSDVVDLSQSMTPSPSLWQIFPWGEVAVQIALVLCMGLFMLSRSGAAQKAIAPVQAELAKHSWAASKPQTDLQNEQQLLTQKVDAIRKFVTSRILWTSYTHDISVRLPTTATLKTFQGICELESSGKMATKPKKSFIISAAAPISEDGTTPKEIDGFLTALRGHPLLQRDFPVVKLADIKCSQTARNGQRPDALFTVICLPKDGGLVAANGPKKSPKKEEGH